MGEILIKVIMGLMLLFCGVQDAFKKKIFVWMIALGAILLGACLPFCNTFSIPERIGGLAVGACVLIISKATGGKIGMGDGYLLCVTGLGLGFWGNLELFAVSLMLAAVIAIILLAFRFADRKKSIPFVPFMFLGYLFIVATTVGTGG